MNQLCQPAFEESLLSGYVDGELTQADRQRVRLHLEGCADCRRQVEEIRQIRAAAASTPFPVPGDEEWREAPRTAIARWTRVLGWLLVGVSITAAAWLGARSLLEGSGDWLEKALIVTLGSGVLMLFVSVLSDRLRSLKSDRYRRVLK